MPDAPGEADDAASVFDWIADVLDEDRDDSSRPTAPPADAVPPESLLHRVVDAEGIFGPDRGDARKIVT